VPLPRGLEMAPAAEAAWEAVLSIGLVTAFRRLLRLAKAPPPQDPPEGGS